MLVSNDKLFPLFRENIWLETTLNLFDKDRLEMYKTFIIVFIHIKSFKYL